MGSSLPDNLHDWLSWLERQHPVSIDMGLERISKVAYELEICLDGHFSSHVNAPIVITVAGTNGKGSTIAALEALLQNVDAEQTVGQAESFSFNLPVKYGKYTSPHLTHFNERIVINGRQASDMEICRAFEQVEAARARVSSVENQVSLTYFEFTTLAALYLFQSENLDFWLLEVGLGGRLDAVNIVDPTIAIVTAIGYDHQDYLGETLDAIGREKAGIARANTPVYVADPMPPNGLLQGIEERQAILTLMPDEQFDRWRQRSPQLHPASWWAAEKALMNVGLRFSESLLAQLALSVSLIGRMDTRSYKGRRLLLDVSHNVESVRRLANWLKAEKANSSNAGENIALMAAMHDKPCDAMVETMLPVVDKWNFCDLTMARAKPASELATLCQHVATQNDRASLPIHQFDNMKTALNSLVQSSGANDKIVIFGSFFTVAAALESMTD